MSFRYEVRLSGAGGQGLILAGKIIAEAAAIYDNNTATQSQSYGPEARGGASRSEVIISDDVIDYPKAEKLDFLLALTQEACDKYHKDLKKGGTLLVDSEFATNIPEGDFRVYAVPITETAKEKVGRTLVANLVALGIFTALSSVVSPRAIESAILSRVPKGTEELNLSAFRKGLKLGKDLESDD